MPYLNIDLDYFDHPKTVRLVGLLGRGADLLPIRLWSYCGKYHAENGELIGYSPEEIETAVKWWGPTGRAVEALLRPFRERPGFLERIENGFKVHDWQQINGHIFALKERAQAGATERWRKYRDAQAMLKQSQSNAGSNTLSSPILPIPVEESPPTPKKKSRKRKPKTLIDDDWAVSPELVAWCAEQKLPEPEYQRPIFINHWKSKDEARADWDASFRNWMLSPYRKDRNHGQNGGGRGAGRNSGYAGGGVSAQQRKDSRLREILTADSGEAEGFAPGDSQALRVGSAGDPLR